MKTQGNVGKFHVAERMVALHSALLFDIMLCSGVVGFHLLSAVG